VPRVCAPFSRPCTPSSAAADATVTKLAGNGIRFNALPAALQPRSWPELARRCSQLEAVLRLAHKLDRCGDGDGGGSSSHSSGRVSLPVPAGRPAAGPSRGSEPSQDFQRGLGFAVDIIVARVNGFRVEDVLSSVQGLEGSDARLAPLQRLRDRHQVPAGRNMGARGWGDGWGAAWGSRPHLPAPAFRNAGVRAPHPAGPGPQVQLQATGSDDVQVNMVVSKEDCR
jgi:hypothetical protein